MTQLTQERPAFAPVGFFERLLAYVIDLVILVAIQYALHVLIGDDRPFGQWITENPDGSVTFDYRMIDFISGVLLPACYFIGSWCLFAASPGKLIMGYRIVHGEKDEVIDGGQAVLRYVGTWVSGIVFCLGYLWVIWDPKKQAWHDKIANTRVIRIR